MSLPRELSIWIQCLNLSYPIKHPKRDFSNGYLFAEILSRFDHDIDMTQYRTGISLESRMANWTILTKAFKRLNIPLSERECDECMYAMPDTAVNILITIHNKLTGKTIRTFVPPSIDQSNTPGYELATASVAIKSRLRSSDMLGGLSEGADVVGTAAAASRQLAQFEQDKKDKRELNQSILRATLASRAMKTKKIDSSSSSNSNAATVEVKQVVVKQAELPAIDFAPHVATNQSINPMLSPQFKAARSSLPSSITALNAAVVNSPEFVAQTNRSKEAIVNFMNDMTDTLHDEDDADLIALVVERIMEDALPVLVQRTIDSPKDFFMTFSLLFTPITMLESTSPSLRSWLILLHHFGAKIARRDAFVAFHVCVDYVLAKILHATKLNPGLCTSLARLIASFCPDPEQRAAMLLQYAELSRDDARIGLVTAGSLVLIDGGIARDEIRHALVRLLDRDIFDEEPRVAACAIHVLANVSQQPNEHTRPFIERYWSHIMTLIDQNEELISWQIKAEVVHLAICFLLTPETQPESITIKELCTMITRLILRPNRKAKYALSLAALPYLSTVIDAHLPMRSLFLSLLYDRSDVRMHVLGNVESQVIDEWDRVTLIGDLRSIWNPLTVILAVIDDCKAHKCETLAPYQIEVLAAAFTDLTESSDEVSAAFASLREHLLAALPNTAGLVCDIFSLALQNESTQGHVLSLFLGEARILNTLVTVFSESSDADRTIVKQFLAAWNAQDEYPSVSEAFGRVIHMYREIVAAKREQQNQQNDNGDKIDDQEESKTEYQDEQPSTISV